MAAETIKTRPIAFITGDPVGNWLVDAARMVLRARRLTNSSAALISIIGAPTVVRFMLTCPSRLLTAIDRTEFKVITNHGRVLRVAYATELSLAEIDAIATQAVITLRIGRALPPRGHGTLTRARGPYLHTQHRVGNRRVLGSSIPSSSRSPTARHREECHKGQDKSAILHSEEWSTGDYRGRAP